MLGILFSLIPLVGWGTADYIASKFSKKLDPATINLFFSVGSLIISLLVCSLLGFPEFTASALLKYLVISLALTGGFLSMVKAFSIGATGVVAPIANAYAVLTAIISVAILGEEIKLSGAIAIIVIIAGLTLLTYKKDPNHNKKDFELSVKFSVLALVLFGVGFAMFDVASTQEWYQNNMLFQLVTVFVAISIYSLWLKKDRVVKLKQAAKIPLLHLGAVFGGLGAAGLFLAIDNVDNIAIPAVVAAAAPLMTAFLAYKFDKEHLTIIQRFATIVIVSGIVLLSI